MGSAVRCLSTPLFSFRVLLLVGEILFYSLHLILYLATILPDLLGHHFKQPYGKEYGRFEQFRSTNRI